MSEYSGYLFAVNEAQRAHLVKEYIERDNSFSDTLSAPDWGAKVAELFLIALGEDKIHYAALARRGRRVATQKHQIRFSNFVQFEPAIPFSEIERQIRPILKQHFIRSASGMGSRVPPATWKDLLRVIKQLRPNSGPDLDQLERLRRLGRDLIQTPGFRVVAHERDAVNIALRMSGFDYKEILDWSPPDHKLAPFLRGLSSAIAREDSMVNHDAQVFGDWRKISDYQVGAVVFEHGLERLTVINVNRHKLEETLGVDLIYYFHNYDSYVMVQYKRMTKQNGQLGYRPTEASYRSELERMREFERSFRTGKSQTDLFGYRLHSGVFYFKLCPAEVLEPTSTEMIPGMYIPLDYWDILVSSRNIVGPRGGKCITYDNVGRYFNNTFFVDLVKAGWIGSAVIENDVITKIIRAALDRKRSVILAAKHAIG